MDFTITERDLPEVQGEMARGTLKALVRLPSEPEDAARAGEMNFLDNAVQNATGTVDLRATLANADRHFWPGQFVNVRWSYRPKKEPCSFRTRPRRSASRGRTSSS